MNTELFLAVVNAMSLGNLDLFNALGPLHQQCVRFALVKYGGGIVQMSGSIAGTTHARNRFGNYARARTKPINPKSPRQVAARIIMMYLAEQWRESPMDDAKRTAWQTYADSVDWHNKLGEIVKLTGFNMFIRANAAILQCGGSMVTDGPEDLGLPNGDPQWDVTRAEASGQTLDVKFDDTMEWCDEDNAFMAYSIGQPQNATRNFFDGPWRYWSRCPGSSVAPPSSPILGVPVPPWTLVTGQKIWCRMAIIRKDGRMTTKQECNPVIVEAGP